MAAFVKKAGTRKKYKSDSPNLWKKSKGGMSGGSKKWAKTSPKRQRHLLKYGR